MVQFHDAISARGMPDAVAKRYDAGARVLRQGDLWIVETARDWMSAVDLPSGYRWDAETRTVLHDAHAALHVPFPATAVAQRKLRLQRQLTLAPCAPTHPASNYPMTFAQCLDILGWSTRHAARELRVSEATARRWRDGQEPTPDALAWVKRVAAHRVANPPPAPARKSGRVA